MKTLMMFVFAMLISTGAMASSFWAHFYGQGTTVFAAQQSAGMVAYNNGYPLRLSGFTCFPIYQGQAFQCEADFGTTY